MKAILIFLSICSTAMAQTATYNEVITKQKTGVITEYIASSGERFKTGDTLQLGSPFRNENYDYIRQNAGIEYYPLTALASGSYVVIKRINSTTQLVQLRTTNSQGNIYGLIVLNLEEAIKSGEIKSSLLSSDQALEKLKSAKDKLDLGLITQEKYDSLKAVLAKFID